MILLREDELGRMNAASDQFISELESGGGELNALGREMLSNAFKVGYLRGSNASTLSLIGVLMDASPFIHSSDDASENAEKDKDDKETEESIQSEG